MGKPKPPDPVKTASAQTGTNIGTAVANTTMGQVNQYTPEGSLEYSQRGTQEWTDPLSGKVYQLPQWAATTTLTPEQQAIFNENQGAQMGLAETANQQSSFLKDYLGSPADFDTSAIEGRIYELGSQRLDPRFEKEQAAAQTRLAQQGLERGSDAWNAEMEALNNSKTDAYNQLLLQGRGQAFNELAAMRNQPINEITALLSGSQVSMPNVALSQPSKAPTVDYAGLVNENYKQRAQNYNTIAGGLFGLGGNVLGAGMMPGGFLLK